MEINMAVHFIVALSVLLVLVQGSHILQVEPESAVESHQVGGVSSGAPIRFPEVRPAPQTQSSIGGYRGVAGTNPVPRSGAGPRPKAVSRPAAPAPHRALGGPHNRPLTGGNAGRPNTGAGYGNPHRNHIQKPYSIL